MPTIREVADKAGVSLTTVSHVINNTRFVAEETRQRVLTAMQELHYRPNALARSLRRGKTNTLGLILPDSANPFFAEVAHSIEDAAFQLGYSVILCNTEGDSKKEFFYVDVLSKKQVDGIIFMASGDQADSLDFIISQNLPVVVVDRDLPNVVADAVLTNNCQGGYQATHHLLDLGHRRIAIIAGPSNLTPSAERVTGYREALKDYGITPDERLVLRGDYHPESGFQSATFLFNLPEPPTAIFACNDLMALGVLRAAATFGRRVPQDLSVVGFDNIELSNYSHPPLTSVTQRKDEIGFQAATILVRRIVDKTSPPARLILPTELVVRLSTGPVPSLSPDEPGSLTPPLMGQGTVEVAG
jgi:LacI family transcriptional regulator